MDSGGTTAWYLTDALGSVRDVVNVYGTITYQASYDAFGNILSQSGGGGRFGFAGMQLDSTTGLDYDQARNYISLSGRFVSQDPIGFLGGDPDLYRYVGNNPTSDTDPSGLFGNGPKKPTLYERLYNAVVDMFTQSPPPKPTPPGPPPNPVTLPPQPAKPPSPPPPPPTYRGNQGMTDVINELYGHERFKPKPNPTGSNPPTPKPPPETGPHLRNPTPKPPTPKPPTPKPTPKPPKPKPPLPGPGNALGSVFKALGGAINIFSWLDTMASSTSHNDYIEVVPVPSSPNPNGPK